MASKRGIGALIVFSLCFWTFYAQIDPAISAEKEKKSSCPGPGQELAIHNMIRAGLGELKEKNEKVLRMAEEWTTFWSTVKMPLTPAPIDFKKDMIIAVSAGVGRGVVEMEIVGVEKRKSCLHVTVVERVLPDKMKDILPLRPFHIVRISSSPGPVVFEYTQTTSALDPMEKIKK